MLLMACSFALLFREASSLARKAFPEIAPEFPRAGVARSAGDAAPGMTPRAAQVEARQRGAVVRMAQYRPRRPDLVERELPVEDVAAGETEFPLEVRGRERAMADDARAEARRVRLDDVEDALHRLALSRLPVGGRIEVLAEETRHVRAFRRQAVVERARDHHLDDRRPGDALGAGIEVRPVHVAERGRHDDPRAVVRPLLRQNRDAGKRGQGAVHAEGPRAALIASDALPEVAVEPRSIDQLQEKELRVDVGDDGARGDLLAAFKNYGLFLNSSNRCVALDLDA